MAWKKILTAADIGKEIPAYAHSHTYQGWARDFWDATTDSIVIDDATGKPHDPGVAANASTIPSDGTAYSLADIYSKQHRQKHDAHLSGNSPVGNIIRYQEQGSYHWKDASAISLIESAGLLGLCTYEGDLDDDGNLYVEVVTRGYVYVPWHQFDDWQGTHMPGQTLYLASDSGGNCGRFTRFAPYQTGQIVRPLGHLVTWEANYGGIVYLNPSSFWIEVE